jgi:hypothetical protein
VGIGELTKQLAQHAVEGIVTSDTPATPAVPENVSSIVTGEIMAMQKGLKEDQELVITYTVGSETIRVREIFVRSPQVAVLIGTGLDKALTRVICSFDTLTLVCKPMPVAAGATPLRVRIAMPKPPAA